MPVSKSKTALRECAGCGEEKPASTEFFQRDSRRLDGLRSRCKVCTSRKTPKPPAHAKLLREGKPVPKARADRDPRFHQNPGPEKQVDMTLKTDEVGGVNSRAILRLIKKHRNEFDFYVFEETRAMRGVRSTAPGWVGINERLRDPDEDLLPGFLR